MCITTGEAELSNTLIYVGEGRHNHQDVHVLAYQNIANNKHSGPNAMVLPFPTGVPMTEKNIIDTTSFGSFLKDITESCRMRGQFLGGHDDMVFGCAANGALVFDVGSYTVVLAENVKQIPEALKKVPESKRPEISYRFLLEYGQMYSNQPVAVCCWNGYIEAEPLLWWYVPRDKGTLFIPTMDAHDGNAPDINASVMADHIVMVGSSNRNNVGHHYRIDYNNVIPDDVRELLPTHAYAARVRGLVKNGDMFVQSNRLGKGNQYKDMPRAVRGDIQYWLDGWS